MNLRFLPRAVCALGASHAGAQIVITTASITRILAVVMTLAAAPAFAQFIDVQFESATALDDFTQRTSGAVDVNGSPMAASGFAFTSGSGRSGSGGITHIAGGTTDVSLIYTPVSIDVSTGAKYDLSVFFKSGASGVLAPTATGAVVQLGLSGRSDTSFNGDSGDNFISARLIHLTASSNTYSIETQVKTTTGATVTGSQSSGFSLAASTWYKLSVSVQQSPTANTFSFTMGLENWGSTGAAFVSTTSGPTSGTFTNSTLYNDTTTYAGFRAQEGQTGAVAFDSVTVVPEPASALLALCGGAAMLLRRRRV